MHTHAHTFCLSKVSYANKIIMLAAVACSSGTQIACKHGSGYKKTKQFKDILTTSCMLWAIRLSVIKQYTVYFKMTFATSATK